jgi:nitroreductase
MRFVTISIITTNGIIMPFNLNKIAALIYYRKSSKAYQKNKPIPSEDILSFFEAARWAPSANNIQPWRYIVFSNENPEQIEKMRSCLTPANQAWANEAPLLILSCVMLNKDDGSPNKYALHDLGLANENLLLQIRSLGYNCRPMGGFDVNKTIELFHIPDEVQPLAVVAAGYPLKHEKLSESLKQDEARIRERNEINQWLYNGVWGENILFE